MSKEYEDLNNKGPTIQLRVEKMERDTARQAGESERASQKRSRSKPIRPARRPSRERGTESMAGPCKVCGANSWDTDDIRGETSCSECGYVASENMIDPGAEWINHLASSDHESFIW